MGNASIFERKGGLCRMIPASLCVIVFLVLCPLLAKPQQRAASPDALSQGFQNPPASAKLRCYWWWLNGHTDEATITRDLEEMHAKGYGGVLLVDANGASQNGNGPVPAGPEFGSHEWTKLYIHALREADRLGLEVTLNITSGWNLGGPQVQPADASKVMTWSRRMMTGSLDRQITLETPPAKNGFYRDIAVLAYPLHRGDEIAGETSSPRAALSSLKVKSASAEMGFSMPDASGLLTDASSSEDEDMDLSEVRNITNQMDANGALHWTAPSGDQRHWEVLRIGYTITGAKVSTSSGDWQGLAIDYLDPHALDLYWNTSVMPLLEAGRPYTGRTLKYVASDSWELGGTNWTPAFREEFQHRRGYDPVSYLPIVAGRIVGSRDLSTRFLADLRRTVGDLVDGHYDHLAALAAAYGMGTQCESGGPHGAPLDGLETFRSSAIPQTEYWAMSPEHRSGQADRYFVKEAASAAHIYGKPLVADEGMTSIGNQWNESIGMNLRPSFDEGLTEGMNRLVWHEFTSSPAETGLPGQEYFAGTHMNPNVTWWRDAAPFFLYLNRSQFLLQQGEPVEDLLYYYGDEVPNFVRLKQDDPAKVLPGYDYDVTSTDALLGRIELKDGSASTQEGIHYKALALPASRILPLAALERAEEYVRSGGTIIGQRPLRSQGIVKPEDSHRFQSIVSSLWGPCDLSATHRVAIGKGQLFCDSDSRRALKVTGVLPDFETAPGAEASLDYIHRRSGRTEIYFVRNTTDKPVATTARFRVKQMQPELWHADTGAVERTALYSATEDGRTMLPITLGPAESVFILFRDPATLKSVASIARNGVRVYSASEPLNGDLEVHRDGVNTMLVTSSPGKYHLNFADNTSIDLVAKTPEKIDVDTQWTLGFPVSWGAPAQVSLDRLQSWTESKDAGVRYFSGRATYQTTITLTAVQAAGAAHAKLDLGEVHEVAVVRINGRDAGTLWKAAYAVRIDGLVHAGSNMIEVDVTNLWPNRLIGDAQDPSAKHYTSTNIRKYTKDSPLLPSGLLGPVIIEPITIVSTGDIR